MSINGNVIWCLAIFGVLTLLAATGWFGPLSFPLLICSALIPHAVGLVWLIFGMGRVRAAGVGITAIMPVAIWLQLRIILPLASTFLFSYRQEEVLPLLPTDLGFTVAAGVVAATIYSRMVGGQARRPAVCEDQSHDEFAM